MAVNSEDLAIGTYRHAVATTIPEMTKVAWGKKRGETLKVVPGATRERIVFNLRRGQAVPRQLHNNQRALPRVDALSASRLRLANTDFDTGRPTARGEYSLADDTYDELLEKPADRKFANVPATLRSNMAAFYGDVDSLPTGTADERRRSEKARQRLAGLLTSTTR
jgi:hypothetical protein